MGSTPPCIRFCRSSQQRHSLLDCLNLAREGNPICQVMIYELNPRLARFQICLTMVVVVVYSIPSIFKVMHKSYERVDDVVSKLITKHRDISNPVDSVHYPTQSASRAVGCGQDVVTGGVWFCFPTASKTNPSACSLKRSASRALHVQSLPMLISYIVNPRP